MSLLGSDGGGSLEAYLAVAWRERIAGTAPQAMTLEGLEQTAEYFRLSGNIGAHVRAWVDSLTPSKEPLKRHEALLLAMSMMIDWPAEADMQARLDRLAQDFRFMAELSCPGFSVAGEKIPTPHFDGIVPYTGEMTIEALKYAATLFLRTGEMVPSVREWADAVCVNGGTGPERRVHAVANAVGHLAGMGRRTRVAPAAAYGPFLLALARVQNVSVGDPEAARVLKAIDEETEDEREPGLYPLGSAVTFVVWLAELQKEWAEMHPRARMSWDIAEQAQAPTPSLVERWKEKGITVLSDTWSSRWGGDIIIRFWIEGHPWHKDSVYSAEMLHHGGQRAATLRARERQDIDMREGIWTKGQARATRKRAKSEVGLHRRYNPFSIAQRAWADFSLVVAAEWKPHAGR